MRLTDKQAKNLSGATWVDYFRGYPNLCDCRAENNNWRKMHHLPMIRRRGKGNERYSEKIGRTSTREYRRL